MSRFSLDYEREPATYEELNVWDKKTVDGLREFGSITQFARSKKDYMRLYTIIHNKYRFLIDVAFGKKLKKYLSKEQNLANLDLFFKTKKRKPKSCSKDVEESFLGNFLQVQLRQNREFFYTKYPEYVREVARKTDEKEELTKKIIELYEKGEKRPSLDTKIGRFLGSNKNFFSVKLPNWYKNTSRKERLIQSFEKMIKNMPKDVIFLKEQKWEGVRKKYKFKCLKYGYFIGVPERLYRDHWRKGRSGHPIGGKGKYIKNIETSSVFKTIAKAKESVKKGDINLALKTGGKAGGYHWAYCDENGNIID